MFSMAGPRVQGVRNSDYSRQYNFAPDSVIVQLCMYSPLHSVTIK